MGTPSTSGRRVSNVGTSISGNSTSGGNGPSFGFDFEAKAAKLSDPAHGKY